MTLNSITSDSLSAADANLVPISRLAFLGDAVMELMVRESLVLHSDRPFRLLNAQKAGLVSAHAQAEASDRLLPMLDGEELAVYRRGKNSKHKNYPKTASALDYCKATGLEALMGFLYLKGDAARLRELFSVVVSAENFSPADGGSPEECDA